jgi:iron complex outermembrane recepter protein
MKINTLFLIFFSFTFSSFILAQPPQGGMRPGAGAKAPAIGRIYGKIVDNKSKSIEYATVTLLAFNKDSLITGALTQSNGDFSLEKIPFGRYRVRVQFISFKTLIKPVSVTQNTIEQDIGNLSLIQDDKELKAATVTATKPTVIMGVDRRIYNVEQDITSRGGTAVDVMKNIPGLTVDADGNVALRNNSPTIFIDGRPTTMTLDQLPSDQIDRVEVITNPSAKYDASASGGIVNVVLKKNTKPGYNGMIGLNTGTNQFDAIDKNGVTGNLNIKEGKVNFFISYNLNYNNAKTNGSTSRTNLSKNIPTGQFNQNDVNDASRLIQFGRIGFDYTVSNRNTLSVSQNIVGGQFATLDNQTFSQTNASSFDLYTGTRLNDQKNSFQNYTSQLLWKHTYPKQGKEWSADVDYNMGSNSSSSLFTTNSFDNLNVPFLNNPQLQTNTSAGQNHQYTFQFDFTNPISDTEKIEFGVKSNYKISQSYLDVEVKDSTGENKKDPYLSTNYMIYDNTNAAYVNYTNMFAGIGYIAGMRFEQTHFNGNLTNKDSSFKYYYPDGLNNLAKAFFPSLYLSKKININNEVQLNFSRKINRPGFMQIMPFIMLSDKNNYQIGNPALAPEFNNLMEANYNHIFGIGNWLSSAYLRYQESPITQIVRRSNTDTNVLVTSFTNGTNAVSYGWENTLKLSFFSRKMDVSFNANIFYTTIKASSDTTTIENSGISWNGKAIASYKLPSHFTLQVNGSYEAPRIILQGKTKEVYSVDLALNKDVTKKLSFNFTLNDVFNTRRFGSVYTTEYFTQDLTRRRDTRFFKIGLVYRFGEMDASIFKKKAKRTDSQNSDQMDF